MKNVKKLKSTEKQHTLMQDAMKRWPYALSEEMKKWNENPQGKRPNPAL